MERYDYKNSAAKLICVAFAVLFIYIVFEFAIGIVLPFAIAYAIGVPINKLAKRLHRATGVPHKLWAFALIFMSLAAVGYLVFLGFDRLASELETLVRTDENGSELGRMLDGAANYINSLSKKTSQNTEGLQKLTSALERGIFGAIESFISAISALIMSLVRKAPKFVISLLVTVLASFYFAFDFDGIKERVLSLIPKKLGERANKLRSPLFSAVKSYAKAYLLIMLITFGEVFLGLLIMRKKYALLIALGVALVDILPVFGAGTVLLPWSAVSFFTSDPRTGTGLLILYGVITIVRQIAEPKIVGESLGIHPLAALFSMFAGLSLFGISGMLLGPCVFIVLRELLKNE